MGMLPVQQCVLVCALPGRTLRPELHVLLLVRSALSAKPTLTRTPQLLAQHAMQGSMGLLPAQQCVLVFALRGHTLRPELHVLLPVRIVALAKRTLNVMSVMWHVRIVTLAKPMPMRTPQLPAQHATRGGMGLLPVRHCVLVFALRGHTLRPELQVRLHVRSAMLAKWTPMRTPQPPASTALQDGTQIS